MRTFTNFLQSKVKPFDEAFWSNWFGGGSQNVNPHAEHPSVKQNPRLLKFYGLIKQKLAEEGQPPQKADEIFKMGLDHGPQAAEYHLYNYLQQNKPIPPAPRNPASQSQGSDYTGDMRTYTPGRGGIMGGGTNWS